MFTSEAHLNRHKRVKNSNCSKTKLLYNKARAVLDSELTIVTDVAHSSSLMGQQVGEYLLSPGCMASLSTSGKFVRNEIINVSLFIFNQLEHTTDYYFDLHFMHSLIGNTGYNYDAVNSWTGTTNIFTKEFLHFALVFNKRHVHFAAHVAEKLILTYDFLGVNQVVIAKVILRYLCDEFQSVHGRVQVPTLLLLMDNLTSMTGDWIVSSLIVQAS